MSFRVRPFELRRRRRRSSACPSSRSANVESAPRARLGEMHGRRSGPGSCPVGVARVLEPAGQAGRHERTSFIWFSSVISAPVVVVAMLVRGATFDGALWTCWWAGVFSACLHMVYAVVLQRSYAQGDLGTVYPAARAGGPVLVALVALTLLRTPFLISLCAGLAQMTVGAALLLGRCTGPRGTARCPVSSREGNDPLTSGRACASPSPSRYRFLSTR